MKFDASAEAEISTPGPSSPKQALIEGACNTFSIFGREASRLGAMVFILGLNFPESRLVRTMLQSFYGIGPQVSSHLMARLHIHPTARLGSLSNQTVLDVTAELSNMKIENDLRREVRDNIRRLRDMGAYRGRRHAMNMPVRGQNTRSQTSTANKLNRVDRFG